MTSNRRRASEEEYFARHDVKHPTASQAQTAQAAPAGQARFKAVQLKQCPKCEIKLETVSFEGVELDRCRSCNGTWLDDGELERPSLAEDPTLRVADLDIPLPEGATLVECGEGLVLYALASPPTHYREDYIRWMEREGLRTAAARNVDVGWAVSFEHVGCTVTLTCVSTSLEGGQLAVRWEPGTASG